MENVRYWKYLHEIINIWIWNNFGFFLPSDELFQNLFRQQVHNDHFEIFQKIRNINWIQQVKKTRNLLYFQHPDSELKNLVFP